MCLPLLSETKRQRGLKGTAPYPIRPEKGRALKLAGLYRMKVSHPGWPARLVLGFPMMRPMRSGIRDRIASGTCLKGK